MGSSDPHHRFNMCKAGQQLMVVQSKTNLQNEPNLSSYFQKLTVEAIANPSAGLLAFRYLLLSILD